MAHKFGAGPKLDLLDDSVWSDDEGEGVGCVASTPSRVLKWQNGEKSAKDKIFSGDIVIPNCRRTTETMTDVFMVPLPHIPHHVTEILGEAVISTLWSEFLHHGTDESELLETKYIPDVEFSMKKLGHELPFHEVELNIEGNEYIDFSTVLDKLALGRNRAGVLEHTQVQVPQLPPCCATGACFVHLRNEKRVISTGDDRPDFRLDVIYRRWILEKKGVVRINDTPSILDDADIEYDKDALSDQFWAVRGDALLLSYEDLADVVSKIRLDKDDQDDQLDLYRLPRWLMNEFIPQEVAMFRHHFMMIDVDCGGSIDAEELQLLGESLGNKLSLEEAEHLIAEHDDDNSGTIDFAEFMGLMFKILRGTVDVENDKLGQAMIESRSQIKLFQEIENIKEFPPEFVKIKQYGGNPVECEYFLEGPTGSLYEGGTYTFKVVYLNGYPYNCPECFIVTRIIGVNMITQTNGYSILPHVKLLWDTSWDTRQLLSHVLGLLIEPMPSYLEPEMLSVVNCFLKDNFEISEEEYLVSSYFGGDHMVASSSYKDRLARMPRLSQMHLNIVAMYLSDRMKYEDIVKQYVQKFAC